MRSLVQTVFAQRAYGLAVLAYHGITNPQRFAAQLDHLVERYRPIAPSDLVRSLDGGTDLPPRAVLVTFDDADPSHLQHALPRLQERGLRALAFVVPGLLDGDRPFWWQEAAALARAGGTIGGREPIRGGTELFRWLKTVPDDEREAALEELRATASRPAPAVPQLTRDELRELDAGGVEIGNHSLSHPILPRCSDDKLRRELEESHERLTALLVSPPRFFAFPNGDHDPRAEALLRRLGYRAAFRFDHRRTSWPPVEPWRVSRLRTGSETPLSRFEIILSGLHPAIHHLLGRP